MKNYAIPTFEYCSQSNMRSLHGSIVYSGNTPIIQATNDTAGCIFKKDVPSIHAEMNVLYRARKILKKVSNPVLVVVRYNRQGDLVNSYPCNLCIELIKKSSIVKVIYSDENGNLCVCKSRDLKHRHTCHTVRRLNIDSVWKITSI